MIKRRRILPNLYRNKSRSRSYVSDEPLIVYTIDDAYLTDYTIAFPLAQQYGIKGTSFAVGNWTGGGRFCDWSQLKEMQESPNWDVQGHTTTHRNLATLSEQEIRAEFEGVNQIFQANGLEPPQHTAYPYGGNNTLVRQIGSEYRKFQRLTGRYEGGLNTRDFILNSPYGVINGMSVDMQDDDEFERIKSAIQWGINTGKIIVIYHHEIKQAPDDYQYSINLYHLEKLYEFIAESGVRTLTMTELYDELFPA